MRTTGAALCALAVAITVTGVASAPAFAAPGPASAPPAAVHGVAPWDTGSHVVLTWTNPTSRSVTGVTVRYARGRTAPARPTVGTGVALPSPKAHQARLSGLSAETNYSVAIWTHDAAHHYSRRVVTHFTTLAAPVANAGVSGQVTDTHGHPLGGVDVHSDTYDSTSTVSTITDATGHYSLSMPPGDYLLEFDGALATGGSSDLTGYQGAYTTFSVQPGETKSGVDEQLDAGAAIVGRVTDSAGHPLAGVLPTADAVTPYVQIDSVLVSYAFEPSDARPSAANGLFILKGLPPTPLRLCFDADAGHVTGGGTDVAGYVGRCADHGTVPVAGQVAVVPTIALTSNSGGALVGTITDAAGRPLAGAFISAESSDPSSDLGYVATTTGADGTYRVDAPGGRYRLCADPGNNGTLTNAPTCAATPVVVRRGAATTGNVRLARAALVSGVIRGPDNAPVSGGYTDVESANGGDGYSSAGTDTAGEYLAGNLHAGTYTACFQGGIPSNPSSTGAAPACPRTRYALRAGWTRLGVDVRLGVGGAISGRITDDQGHPLPADLQDVFLDVERADLTQDAGPSGGGYFLDADGNFTAFGLSTGNYTVCVLNFDVASVGSSSCFGGGEFGEGTPVHVQAGKTTTGVHIELPLGGSVTVTVTDTAGRPIGGVDVAALAPCSAELDECDRLPLWGADLGVTVNGSDVTDAAGQVTLSGLPPGNYAFCLFAYYGATATHNSATGYADACSGTQYDIAVRDQQTVQLHETLAAAGAVTGTVTDALGHPLRGVQVNVSNAGTSDYVNPDDGGYFGEPSGPAADAVTDKAGHYTIRGVQPGSQTVCFGAVDATGGSSTSGYLDGCVGGTTAGSATPVEVQAGQTTAGVDGALVSGAAISGTIKNGAGHVVYGAAAIIWNAKGSVVGEGEPGTHGGYRIDRLPAGTYRVCFDPFGSYRPQCYNKVAWDEKRDPPRATVKIVLAAGQVRTGVNAALIHS